jgi:hypothetical protein
MEQMNQQQRAIEHNRSSQEQFCSMEDARSELYRTESLSARANMFDGLHESAAASYRTQSIFARAKWNSNARSDLYRTESLLARANLFDGADESAAASYRTQSIFVRAILFDGVQMPDLSSIEQNRCWQEQICSMEQMNQPQRAIEHNRYSQEQICSMDFRCQI